MKIAVALIASTLILAPLTAARAEEAPPATPETPAAETAPPAKPALPKKPEAKDEKEIKDVKEEQAPPKDGLAPDLGSRAKNEIGFFVSTLGFPTFNVWNLNLAYNVFPWLRGSVGYGTFSRTVPVDNPIPGEKDSADATITTFGAAAWAFVPGWNFSPTVGLGFSSQSIGTDSKTAELGDVLFGLSSIDTTYLTLNVGFDWQTKSGLTLGLGMAFFLSADELVTETMDKELGFSAGLPYLYIGGFFDIF